MNSKQMGYDSQKTILSYFEANKRFEICRRCKALAKIDKFVPLYIDRLEFSESLARPSRMTMNKTVYQFGTIRNFENGNSPRVVQSQNLNGGIPQFFNENGFQKYNHETSPGDVVIKRNNEAEEPPFNVQDAERQLQEVTYVIALIKNENVQPMDLENNWPMTMEHLELLESVKDLMLATLLPYQHIGRELPFKPCSLLTIIPEEGENCKWLHKEIKIHDCQKQVAEKFFDGRKVINVKHLKIMSKKAYHVILRLPLNLKLKVQELKMDDSVALVLNALEPIIDTSSGPLKRFMIYSLFQLDTNHRLLSTAEEIDIRMAHRHLHHLVLNLPNKKVRIRLSDFSKEDMVTLVRKIIDDARKIGTCFTFDEYSPAAFDAITQDADISFEGCRHQDDGSLIIPLNHFSNITLCHNAIYLTLKIEVVATT